MVETFTRSDVLFSCRLRFPFLLAGGGGWGGGGVWGEADIFSRSLRFLMGLRHSQ